MPPLPLTPIRPASPGLRWALLGFVTLFARITFGADLPVVPASAAPRLPVLFVCGDSTAAPSHPVIQGWGEMIGEFFDPTKVTIQNRALGGRSARTFIGEGRWESVRSQARQGDIILLQFGHNDSKSAISSDRYDLSGLGDEVEESTNPRTGEKIQIRTFGYYLHKMVVEGVATGASVIVLSPVPRSKWAGGKIVRGEENHGLWAAAVAKSAGVPFVDVNALIADVYDPIGRPRIKALYFPQDNTHTNPAGARLNAASIVAGLVQLKHPAILAYLKESGPSTAAEVIAGVPKAATEVKLALPLANAFPASNATAVCPDTPLRLTFTSPPTLGPNGKIQIIDAATNVAVDTIDLGAPTPTKIIGGLPDYSYYPVIVSGPQATIYPRNNALTYGKTYYVTIDAGVFKGDASLYAGTDGPTSWRFTTKPAPPASGTTKLTVAADGTGDFCTVQGALDFIPDGNTTPTTISLRKGLYTEMVFFTNKHAITIIGEDRKQTVIAYATNDRFNGNSGGNPFGAANPNPAAAVPRRGAIYHRGVFLAHHVDDLVLANLTIRNTTPQGGSQAEAIIFNGTPDSRAILKDVDLYSYQDTLQINGQAYLDNCYIEGDVDFMWGTGPVMFENCTARSLRSGAYYTQIRNPPTNHGFVYLHCTFDGAQGIMGNYLSRIGPARFPASEVVLIDCLLGPAVGPVAWQWQGPGDLANIHFWEFNSHDPAGKPVDTSFRLAGSRQLLQPGDAALIANYSNHAFVLGHNWEPKSAPIFATAATVSIALSKAGAPAITVQPVDQLALVGTSPSLTVVATGSAGRLSYQWTKNGQPIPGVTQPTLRLESLTWADAAVYAVIVSNSAGSVTSDAARLTPVAPATWPAPGPKLPVIPSTSFDVTAFGAIGDGTTDNTAAFKQAIDAAVASGGGIVVVPASAKPYLSGPISLASNIELHLDPGATLRALPFSAGSKPGSYPLGGSRYPDFINCSNAHDVALTGSGTINGDGEPWWAAFRANRDLPHRPNLIRFSGCERVLLSGVTLTRSPMFHAALSAINHLTVFGLVISTPEGPNTDGLDPSGQHQLFQNCAIATGDDNLVMKPGGTFCSDITVADCWFGEGHGMSVGGQSNRGLDGMVVRNCYFDSTTSALRLKADPTQGGEVKNITYSNLVMVHVPYPIVFYSYYNKVGSPGSTSGGNQTTVEKVKQWNATPPNSLTTRTLPSWKNIQLDNITATDTKGYNIIYGLPLEGGLIDNVRLHNVHITGGPGFEIFDATNIQFTGTTDVGHILACNALAIVNQPQNQTVAPGATATFSVTAAGSSGATDTAPTFHWTFNGHALADGPTPDGTVIAGSSTATLQLDHIASSAAGKYAAIVSNTLDTFDSATKAVVPNHTPVSATSSSATLVVTHP